MRFVGICLSAFCHFWLLSKDIQALSFPPWSRRLRQQLPGHPSKSLLTTRFLSRSVVLGGNTSSLDRNTLSDNTGVMEAQILQQRAKELYQEAAILEEQLRVTRQQKRMQDDQTRKKIDFLFHENRPMTPFAIAKIMRDERWSVDQAISVLEALHHDYVLRISAGSTNPRNITVYTENTSPEQLSTYMDLLIEAAEILDSETSRTTARWGTRGAVSLQNHRKGMDRTEEIKFQKQLAIDVNMALNSSSSVQEYLQRKLGLPSIPTGSVANATLPVAQSSVATPLAPIPPYWIPAGILKYVLLSNAKLRKEDVDAVRERVLAGSRFFCTTVDSKPMAALFRGNLRIESSNKVLAISPEKRNITAEIFEELQWKLEMDTEGLGERVQFLFLQDPFWKPSKEQPMPQSVILVIPKSVVPDDSIYPRNDVAWVLSRLAFPLTALTSFGYSISCYALNPGFFSGIVNHMDASVLNSCLPFILGTFGISVIHEAAHLVVAKLRGIRIGFPIPLPSSEIGTFGCITPIRSFPKTRSHMLDLALSGPLAAMVFSLLSMVIGTRCSITATSTSIASYPYIPSAIFKSSFLTTALLSYLAPKILELPVSQPVPVHPLFLVGFQGLLVSSLNLLPITRLDGGRACTATLGPRIAAAASAGTLLFLLSTILSRPPGLVMSWILSIVLFQRRTDIPARDDVTPINNVRRTVWWASLVIAVLSLLPFPGGRYHMIP